MTISISALSAYTIGGFLRSKCFNQETDVNRMFLDDIYWEAVDGSLDVAVDKG